MDLFILYYAISVIFIIGMESGIYFTKRETNSWHLILSILGAPILVPFFIGCYLGVKVCKL